MFKSSSRDQKNMISTGKKFCGVGIENFKSIAFKETQK